VYHKAEQAKIKVLKIETAVAPVAVDLDFHLVVQAAIHSEVMVAV
jgi:hypothetical protein